MHDQSRSIYDEIFPTIFLSGQLLDSFIITSGQLILNMRQKHWFAKHCSFLSIISMFIYYNTYEYNTVQNNSTLWKILWCCKTTSIAFFYQCTFTWKFVHGNRTIYPECISLLSSTMKSVSWDSSYEHKFVHGNRTIYPECISLLSSTMRSVPWDSSHEHKSETSPSESKLLKKVAEIWRELIQYYL